MMIKFKICLVLDLNTNITEFKNITILKFKCDRVDYGHTMYVHHQYLKTCLLLNINLNLIVGSTVKCKNVLILRLKFGDDQI